MNRPADTQKCDNSACSHPFGEHWASFNGGATGCGHRATEQRDSNCACRGFTQIYRPEATIPITGFDSR